jgi:hypothetical protein
MKFSELSTVAKIVTVALIPTLWAGWVWLHTTFETAQASEQKWQAHNQALACRTVAELRAQIRALQAQAQFDKSLSPADQSFIQKQIEGIQNEIRRIDPKGVC